jgi:hypothetical protein
MRLLLVCLSWILVTCCAATAERVIVWMDDDQITKAFAGVTISGVYVDGMPFTETYASGGGITYSDPRKAMTGRWSVVNRSFCTLYEGATTGGCFKVSRHSGNCFEFYFLTSSEREAANDNSNQPSWTARGWDKSKAATCDDKPSA